jgi:hypothetical protein
MGKAVKISPVGQVVRLFGKIKLAMAKTVPIILMLVE